jgi:hypothetical protein
MSSGFQMGAVAIQLEGPPDLVARVRGAFALHPPTGRADLVMTLASSASPADDPRLHGANPVLFHEHVRVSERAGTWWVYDGASIATVDSPRHVHLEVHAQSWHDEGMERMFLPVLSTLMVRWWDHFYLHAAMLQPPHMPVWLLAGQSGSGKSTTVLTLLRGGARWWSDDACLLQGTGSGVALWPMARPFHLTDTTLAQFPELGPAIGPRVVTTGKHSVRVDAVFGSPESAPVTSPVLLVLPGVHDGPTVAVPISQSDGLLELVQSGVWVHVPGIPRQTEQLSAMAELVGQCTVVRLLLGRDALGKADVLLAAVQRVLG